MKLLDNIKEKLGLKIVGHVDMDALRGAQDEEGIKNISNDEINNTWYVQLMKEMSKES